jgi:hypothetical protein
VADPRFFLSPNGKYDPKAELEATIRGFFKKDQSERERAVCRFIARFSWLKEKLDIDVSRLPYQACDDFDKLISREKPENLTIVYPAGYVNSPASMYGHTFLIVGLEGKDRLVSGSINYMAQTGETSGLIFALKGLFGFYPGYFSMMPYYQKVKEYSDFEKRNIWEYTLDFTPEETAKVLMHVAELDNIYSYYYFLDENCSYNLLWLLEAGRPSLRLIDRMGNFVAPIDTIRAIASYNVIRDIRFRPSKAAKIEYLASKLSGEQCDLAIDLANGRVSADSLMAQDIPASEKKFILELAGEYLLVLRGKQTISAMQYSRTLLPLLNSRSSLGLNAEGIEKIPVPDHPERSHDSNRAAAAVGWRSGSLYQSVSWRPTYHSLVDRPDGYTFGEGIVFGNVEARYYSNDRRFVLQRFDVIDIMSIPASNRFSTNFGWKFRGGFSQLRLNDGDDHPGGYFNAGGGLAVDIPLAGRLYGMGEFETNAAAPLRHYVTGGIGGSAGILSSMTRWYTLHLGSRMLWFPYTDRHSDVRWFAVQRVSFSTNTSVILDCSVAKLYGRYEKEASASFNVHF